MSNRILATWCAGGVLAAASAGAEAYRIVDGSFGDAGTGASEVLEGVLEISVVEPACPELPPSLLVDDFQLQAGARSFGPQQPVVFEGGLSLFQIPDQIRFDGDTVELARLRSGGEIVAAGAREVTIRFLDFRAQAPDAGRLVGHLGDTLLPRRISLLGTLYEVDQRVPVPVSPTPGVVFFDGYTDPDALTSRSERDLRASSGVVSRDARTLFPRCYDAPVAYPFPAEEREVGTFSLVASAAEQVEIDFEPRRHGGGLPPSRHGIVSVAILGSADLDVRDVDERSLRLGPGEAEPTSDPGRDRTRRADVNRDGELDLVARFDAREAGIAASDTEVCLFGETTGGTAIEGCDALGANPERQH